MTLTNEQVVSLTETSVLRVVQGHNLLGTEGTLVRPRHAGANVHGAYFAVDALDGSLINGSWFPNRFALVEPQPITGPLPAGTLLRCIEQDHWGDGVYENTFYRIIDDDECDEFIRVADLTGEPVRISGGTVPFGFYPRRFVYYPGSAPVEPTTEKGTTMSNTTSPITREIAATLSIGTALIYTDGGANQGKKYTLDRAGIDVDGDFHGTYEGNDYGMFQSWSYFSLPADSPSPEPTEGTASELQALRVERDAFKADLERVIDALRQEAIDREWCSEYDRFMERLGFEARCTRKFTVRRRATIEWDEEIEANSEDDAREQAANSNPSYVRELDSYTDVESISIVDVEEA